MRNKIPFPVPLTFRLGVYTRHYKISRRVFQIVHRDEPIHVVPGVDHRWEHSRLVYQNVRNIPRRPDGPG